MVFPRCLSFRLAAGPWESAKRLYAFQKNRNNAPAICQENVAFFADRLAPGAALSPPSPRAPRVTQIVKAN
jgi:hypothetical protein